MNKDQALNILEYWHKIEFFDSTELGDISEQGNGAIHYNLQQLLEMPESLPWINRNHIRLQSITLIRFT